MKHILFVLLGLLIISLIPSINVHAADASVNSASELCLPGNYSLTATDCQPDGPSTYQSKMAEAGISLPQLPFPSVKPEFELTYLDQLYGYVHTQNAPVYGSMEDALKNQRGKAIRRVSSSFSYISYIDSAVED